MLAAERGRWVYPNLDARILSHNELGTPQYTGINVGTIVIVRKSSSNFDVGNKYDLNSVLSYMIILSFA